MTPFFRIYMDMTVVAVGEFGLIPLERVPTLSLPPSCGGQHAARPHHEVDIALEQSLHLTP